MAPRDDVLLDFGRAAAERIDHGRAVRALEAPAQRRVVLPFPELARRAHRVERLAAHALSELGGEELVLRCLYGRRLAADLLRRAHEADREGVCDRRVG